MTRTLRSIAPKHKGVTRPAATGLSKRRSLNRRTAAPVCGVDDETHSISAAWGGCRFENDRVKIHLGVPPFVPARKAQIALVVDNLRALTMKLKRAGYRIVEDQPLKGYERRYVDDPLLGAGSTGLSASDRGLGDLGG